MGRAADTMPEMPQMGRYVGAFSCRSPKFKALSDVLEPDRRQVHYSVPDTTGGFRRKELADHYETILQFSLHDGVPEPVRIHFDTARNLLLYDWFAYRFIQVAELHVFSTVEMALRVRLGYHDSKALARLNTLLSMALGSGLLKDEGFRLYRQARERRARESIDWPWTDGQTVEEARDPLSYTRGLINYLRDSRNTLAHGSPMLMPHGYRWLCMCCDLINQIFPDPEYTNEESTSNPSMALKLERRRSKFYRV